MFSLHDLFLCFYFMYNPNLYLGFPSVCHVFNSTHSQECLKQISNQVGCSAGAELLSRLSNEEILKLSKKNALYVLY